MKNHLGLTTTKAAFIENAKKSGSIFIQQPYHLYTESNQRAWQKLFLLLTPKWEKYANGKFLEGIDKLALNSSKIPRLEEINHFLEPLTGFQAKAVSGYVPTDLFFNCLKKREFPTTITIRDEKTLNYLPEPDIFHDIAGHVPMHTDPIFAKILVKFGSLASLAKGKSEEKMKSIVIALSRFFWFTIEFGLMEQNDRLVAYGSGLLSSSGEIEHAIDSCNVERRSFDLKQVIDQPFEIDHFQPLLFVINSFDHLYEEVNHLEKWLLEGKLDHVNDGHV